MKEQTFEQVLFAMKNTEVGLFLKNDQFIKGILVDVKQDHLVVEVAQKVYYFSLQHINALSKNSKDFRVSPRVIPHLNKNHLTDLLNAMKYNWVSINGLNNQEIYGVLSNILEDHIILINNMELLYIPKSYISTIYSFIPEEQIILLNSKEKFQKERLSIQQTNESNIESVVKEFNKHQLDVNQEDILESNKSISVEMEEEFYFAEPLPTQRDKKILLTAWSPMVNEEYTELIPEKLFQPSVEHEDEKEMLQTESLLDEETSIEVNHVKELVNGPSTCEKEKRILLTAWSAMNSDEFTFAKPKKTIKKNEIVIHEPTLITDLKAMGHIEVLDGIEETSATNTYLPPVRKKRSREENAVLLKQYYGLMKHAEENLFNEKINRLEKQYYSLMKHAAKMYRELRDYQLED